MGHRVVSHFVTFRDDTSNEFRLAFRIGADDEESRRHAVFSQHIEDFRCAMWIRAVVKRQVYTTIFGPVIAVARHLVYVIEVLHSSDPFRSINVPGGHSFNGRPTGNITTSGSSVRVEGRSAFTSAMLDRTRTPVKMLAIPFWQYLSTWFRMACRTVPKANGTPSSRKVGVKAPTE